MTLTVVVPCYNSAGYMRRCVESLLAASGPDVEVVLVDDGSQDGTGRIADAYAARYPGRVRAVHKENGGHGSTINVGLQLARGRYFKVVDSDDWVDVEAFTRLVSTLRRFGEQDADVDMVLSNFVYEKEGRRTTRTVRFRRALPRDEVFGWDQVGRLRKTQYFLMHAIVYRTGLLREVGLHLPEHTFYVDNIFAYMPLPAVRRMYYLDVDLYRYYIGRAGQSVAEQVMIGRLDQQLRVNRMMMEHVARTVPPDHPAYGYMTHYLEIVCAVSSTLLLRSGTDAAIATKEAMWRGIREEDELLHRRLRRSTLGTLTNLPGRHGRRVTLAAYRAAQWRVGFN
ncbi:glycosyl transferase [Cellulomonas bogoriensis 69B4 = DSM 16987]|uniref:Glycosyl transferase n=1 Tax=Cellulomonas bogoriensis 69B4 = DSM 16987 TaxID=1386082 RepID=A0A0A0C3M6_9CELL|nr:glycosyl transferase [Cellulomonas bogoriensis 69B4 = DSM 16987]